MAPMKIPGAHYYKRSKMMLGNQSKPYQTNFEIDRLEVKKGISVRSQEWNLNVVAGMSVACFQRMLNPNVV
ncbi:hypothetical protein YC2023_070770 [Brassica napus]